MLRHIHHAIFVLERRYKLRTYKTEENAVKSRPELRCICIGDSIWNMAVELAGEASISVSALLRQLIKKAYQRSKKR